MKAFARVVAESDGRGGTRLTTLRSEAPLVLRDTPHALYLVGGAGGPLGGDDLTLEIEVGPGALLTIRAAAATVALRGPVPGPSRVHVHAKVGDSGELRWLPEPIVAAQGCDHRAEATVQLHTGGRLLWREEVVLGRHAEEGGSVATRTRVDVGGVPLFHHELALGPEHPHASGPAVVGDAGAVGSVVLVDSRSCWRAALVGDRAAVLALDGPGVQVTALAGDARALRRALDEGVGVALGRALVPTRRRMGHPDGG